MNTIYALLFVGGNKNGKKGKQGNAPPKQEPPQKDKKTNPDKDKGEKKKPRTDGLMPCRPANI